MEPFFKIENLFVYYPWQTMTGTHDNMTHRHISKDQGQGQARNPSYEWNCAAGGVLLSRASSILTSSHTRPAPTLPRLWWNMLIDLIQTKQKREYYIFNLIFSGLWLSDLQPGGHDLGGGDPGGGGLRGPQRGHAGRPPQTQTGGATDGHHAVGWGGQLPGQ